mgnify:CR=1 FL=1
MKKLDAKILRNSEPTAEELAKIKRNLISALIRHSMSGVRRQ